MIFKKLLPYFPNYSPINCCLLIRNITKYERIMSTKNKSNKSAKNIVKEVKKENLSVESLKLFAYSPRKTRSHTKIEYDEKTENSSNSNTKKISPGLQNESPIIVKTKSKRNIVKKEKKLTSIAEKQEVVNKSHQNPKRKSLPSEDSGEKIAESVSNLSSDTKNLKWEPQNWQKIFQNLKIMRSSSLAPVDTMGCDKCFDENADEKTKRFHTLVALMLSSQTKDQTTYDAMNRLKSDDLTPKNIAEMDTSKLEQLLNPVSFYKNKAKYLQKTANILVEKYDSDIPKTVDELIKLPGVGPKMAHICMNSAWNIITGIGVDVHVHRISNRLGWVRKTTKFPEDTRRELESWLPYEHWNDINHLMVGFGQTICTPVNPKCNLCLNFDICPSSNIGNSKKNIKKSVK